MQRGDPPIDRPLDHTGHDSARVVVGSKCTHVTRATERILPMYLLFFESNAVSEDECADDTVVSNSNVV